ncbi:unnamed protein product [Paramecium octaurelia]|uniref:Uncharacterized protein n=1 Tax=Paramecium octaurelia TaxID=43137 RepID=A0A8S1SD65_PAROT|nr:unnamed protein product [Paramecium octaurelia]
MRRVKTEQSTLIELIKKKEPLTIQPQQKPKNRKISQLGYFNSLNVSNAKVKLSILMRDIVIPTHNGDKNLSYKIKNKNRSIIAEDKKPIRNNNKPSRFIDIQENQIFKKQYYANPKQVFENITLRNNMSNQRANVQKIKKNLKLQQQTFEQQQIIHDLIVLPQVINPEQQSKSVAYIKSVRQYEKQEQLYHIEGSLEKTIEDFNIRMFGSRTVKKLINSVKPWVNQLQQKKQSKYKRIRLEMVQLLTHIHKLKLTLEEFSKGDVFPKVPYQSPRSEKFFCLCKMNKGDQIQQLLELEKYLVYEYDPSFMTALHWCCVRNCRAAALILLKSGADPDAQDMIGRTPLFLALLHNNNDIAQLLLYHKADPWNKGILDYNEAITHNIEGKTILQQARRTHILLRMTPPAERQFIWQSKQFLMMCE